MLPFGPSIPQDRAGSLALSRSLALVSERPGLESWSAPLPSAPCSKTLPPSVHGGHKGLRSPARDCPRGCVGRGGLGGRQACLWVDRAWEEPQRPLQAKGAMGKGQGNRSWAQVRNRPASAQVCQGRPGCGRHRGGDVGITGRLFPQLLAAAHPPGHPGPGQLGSGVGRGWSDPGYLGSPGGALDTEPRAPSQAGYQGPLSPDLSRPRLGTGRGCLRRSQPAPAPSIWSCPARPEIVAQRGDRCWEHTAGPAPSGHGEGSGEVALDLVDRLSPAGAVGVSLGVPLERKLRAWTA